MALNTNGGTITYSVKVDASGAVVGIKNAESKMTAAASNAGTNSGKSLSKGWAIATGAIAGITSQIFSKVTSIIGSSISGAISRVDTINNFSTVMKNLGQSSEEAAEVIDDLANDKLVGLPTSLDSAAAAVQRLVGRTGNVKIAESYFLALNDAILAGTTDTEKAASAQEQFIQMLSAGRVDAQAWKTVLDACNAQMLQLAQSMGYTSADINGDFYTAIQNGTISMQDLMDQMVKLDTEGTDSITSFSQQAKDNASGIRTAIKNLSTRIEKGISEVINSIGAENISAMLEKISQLIVGLFKVIASVVSFLVENEWVFWTILTIISALTAAVILYTASQIAMNIAIWACPITWIIALVLALIIGIIALIVNIEQVEAFFISVFSAIGDFVGSVVQSITDWFDSLFTSIKNGISNVWNMFVSVFGAIGGWIYNNVISPVAGFFAGLWNGITNGINAVAQGIKNVFGVIGGFIKAPINAIISGINAVIDKINSIQVPDWVPGIGGSHTNFPHVPYLAKGGIVESTVGGRVIVAGEGGEDEWVVPESKMASLIDQLQGKVNGGGDVLNFTFNGVVGTPSELREYSIKFHDAYQQVNKQRFTNA